MLVPIEDIKVKKRIRKDLGDISSLAESMKRLGQITPIVINKKNLLIAGGRRLEAARSLGWRTINAVIMEFSDEVTGLELEIEENTQRRNFTTGEMAEADRRIYRLKNPGFFRRVFMAIAGFIKRLFRIEG